MSSSALCMLATAARRRSISWRGSSATICFSMMRVSCSTAWPMARPPFSTHALEPHRQEADALGRLQLLARDQLAAGHQLGQHGGDGLEGLDLFVGVVARRAVLHHEHAEHAAAAQDRHAHQRMIDLLAGLRAVGEVGMGLRLGQRQRPRMGRDVADQALADAQPRLVHRLGLQALGGEQLQHLAGAHDVGRADLGHHVGGDDGDDLVEPFLRLAAAGHHIAEAAEEQTGSGGPARLGHQPAAPARLISAAGTWPCSRASRASTAWSTSSCRISGERLLLGHHADALAGHQRAVLDVAVDDGAAQRAGPEMLDLQLRRLLVDLAAIDAADHLALIVHEAAHAVIDQRAHRDHGEARIELHRRHGVAGAGADEGLLEQRMGDRFRGADEAGAELAAGSAHLEIAEDGLAAADAAGDEHRHLADRRQDLLRQHAGRDRADMAAGLHALDDDGVGAGAHQLAGDHQGRGEAQQLGAALLDACQRGAGREAAGQHDVPDLVVEADIDQLHRAAGCMVMRLTPKGRSVSAAVAAISAASRPGDIEPEAMTPKPPAFESADTRCRSDTQVMAPPMMASSQPRNSRPRPQS